MKTLLAAFVLSCLAACSDYSGGYGGGDISAQTEWSLINGGGAANTGVLNGEHLPDAGGG